MIYMHVRGKTGENIARSESILGSSNEILDIYHVIVFFIVLQMMR